MSNREQGTRRLIEPTAVGIGLRPPHIGDLLSGEVAVDFLEVLTDNFLDPNSPARAKLRTLARHYPLVLHGVGLNLIGPDEPNPRYIDSVAQLADALDAPWVSDHLCWTAAFGHQHHDLLPFPTSSLLVEWLAERAAAVQRRIGRPLALENLSTYLPVRGSDLDDIALLVAVAQQADCSILLDINNIYVSATNAGRDPVALLDQVEWARVAHVHVAGHVKQVDGIRVDTHDHSVCDDVWHLYRHAWARGGPLVTMVEWDAEIPPLDQLVAEAHKARQVRAELRGATGPAFRAEAPNAALPPPRHDGPIAAIAATAPASRTDLLAWQRALTDHVRTPLEAKHGQLRPQLGETRVLTWVDLPADQAQARLAVYQRQVWLRHFSVLQAELPTVAHLLGLWTFNRLAAAYLLKFPPDDRDLHMLVARWPQFVAHLPDTYLPDGRRLPRAWLQSASAFDLAHRTVLAAPQADRLTAQAAQQRNPLTESWALHPACAIVWAHPEMAALRELALRRGEETPLALPAQAQDVPWLVRAEENTLESRRIEPLRAQLYQRLTDNPLLAALTQLQREHPAITTDHMAQMVQDALRDGLLAGVWLA